MPALGIGSSETFRKGLEAFCALPLLLRMEAVRRLYGPKPAVGFARRIGLTRQTRVYEDRKRLRSAVAWLDRKLFLVPNCYRRVLLEISRDAGAANEKVLMGFRAGFAPGSGHVWLESDPPPTFYETVVSL